MKINRHFIIVTVAAVLIGVTGGLVASSWNSHVAKVHAEQARVAQIQADKQVAHDKAVAAVQTKVNAECAKEVKYFNLLSVSQKKTVETPACQTVTVIR